MLNVLATIVACYVGSNAGAPDGQSLSVLECDTETGSATCGTVGTDGKDIKTSVLPDDAMGPNRKRQRKAFAHQTFNLPDGRLGVVDLGCDRIRFFDPVTMQPVPEMEIRADPGDGPRHALWSKNGKFLFVVNELSSTVTSYACHPASRLFTRVGKWSMLPDGFNRWEADGETLSTKAAAIKLTEDGKILMASNRGHDSIAFYAVDEDTGKLAMKNIAKLTGRFPRDFALQGDPIPCWRPLCFVFRPIVRTQKGICGIIYRQPITNH